MTGGRNSEVLICSYSSDSRVLVSELAPKSVILQTASGVEMHSGWR
jgi:hypothetical protein